MSNYIINPIWFWAVGIIEDLELFIGLFSALFFFAIIILIIIFFADHMDDEKVMKYKKAITKLVICFIVTAIIIILVPSRQDMEKIIIFSKLTEDNISAATNYGKDLVDYMFDKINETTNENE